MYTSIMYNNSHRLKKGVFKIIQLFVSGMIRLGNCNWIITILYQNNYKSDENVKGLNHNAVLLAECTCVYS